MNKIYFIVFVFSGFQAFRAQNFYADSVIQSIEISFPYSNWDYRLDTLKAGSDLYLKADWVKINGIEYKQVGVKYKGNSSYDPSFKKNPLHIELNTFIEQDYQGYVDIKLGNAYADPSMIREVLSYDLLKNYMDCPKANFATLKINGQNLGLYSNVESINKGFCRRNFFGDEGVLVKCNPLLSPSPNTKSNLKYLGSDSSLYLNYYEVKSDYGWNTLTELCDVLSNSTQPAANVLDVDRAIWMLAYNNLFVNLDSYTGAFAQNYYLYKGKQDRFFPVIWDLNMNFGGFPFLGNSNNSLGSLSNAAMQNMSIDVHANDIYWPLIKNLFSEPQLRKNYVAHLKTLLRQCVEDSLYLKRYQFYYNLVANAVYADTCKFYSDSQFQNALTTGVSVGTYTVPGIKSLMTGRMNYLNGLPELNVQAPTIHYVSSPEPLNNSFYRVRARVQAGQNVYLMFRYSTVSAFQKLEMYDDGLHQDSTAGDGVFGVSWALSENNLQFYVLAENSSVSVFSPERAEHEFYEWRLWPAPLKGELVINEFLAENKSDVRNEFHQLADWIELYNNSNHTIGLGDYYLSDSENKLAKYRFVSTATLAPHSFLTVWADEMQQTGAALHANFKLSREGGGIFLGNGLSVNLDGVKYTEQEEDISTGRCPDGTGYYTKLEYPSFSYVNCVTGYPEDHENATLKIFPNPSNGYIFLESLDPHELVISIYDLDGILKYNAVFTRNTEIDLRSYNAGIYILKVSGNSFKLIVNP